MCKKPTLKFIHIHNQSKENIDLLKGCHYVVLTDDHEFLHFEFIMATERFMRLLPPHREKKLQ